VNFLRSSSNFALSAALVAVLVTAPTRAAAVCAPAATGIFPASGAAGTGITATITGSGLANANLAIYGDPGLSANVQSNADTAIAVRLDLDAAAVPGERIIFVDTPGGITGVSFVINAAGGPIVDGLSPPLVATRGETLGVVVSGANLDTITASNVTISGSGVSATSATPSPDGTTLALSLAADATADLGSRAVTLQATEGSAVLLLDVQRPPPTLAAVAPGAAEEGTSVALTLTGANLSGAALVITGTGAATTDVVSPDDTTLTATLTVDPGTASSEARLLIVTTESGQATAEFFIVAAGVPTVTGIEPGAGEPGTTVPVTLKGLRLTGAGVSAAPGDLTVQNVQVVDHETITLEVVIAGGATPGVDHTLTVAGTATATFRVIAAGDPFIGAVSPPFGNRGSTITLFVRGVNLGLTIPGTGVDVSGPKISESNAMAIDDQTVRATLTIDPTASVGSRDVTVELTNAKTATLTAALRVNVPGQVPLIDDVSPGLVEPGVTTPVQVTGTNFTGGGVLVTGPGVAVTDPVFDDAGTLVTFNLTLDADAPAETRSVVVVTENGTARCGLASDPAPPPLVPAKLVKTGARFTVSGSGFRLFVFEFSMSNQFPAGERTFAITDPDGDLVLNRLDAVNVGRAFRSRHRGFVRVRAVTATNRFAVSTVHPVHR
jgi:hypothetical protein